MYHFKVSQDTLDHLIIFTKTVLPKAPARATPDGSNITTGGNSNTQRKTTMLGRVKLNNTFLTCDKGDFNQRAPWSQNQIHVTVVRDTCTTTVPFNVLTVILYIDGP